MLEEALEQARRQHQEQEIITLYAIAKKHWLAYETSKYDHEPPKLTEEERLASYVAPEEALQFPDENDTFTIFEEWLQTAYEEVGGLEDNIKDSVISYIVHRWERKHRSLPPEQDYRLRERLKELYEPLFDKHFLEPDDR